MNTLFRALALGILSHTALVHAAPLSARAQAPALQENVEGRPAIDVVFVLDTTGSMGGLLEGAKRKIWSIASRMAEGKPTPKIRVGLVAFRDRGDEYVTKRFDLNGDLDQVFKNLQTFQANGGGDGPEAVGQGLGEAVKFMSWSSDKKTLKMAFLVGDAPAHDYRDGWKLEDWAKSARERHIIVNAVRCGGSEQAASQFKQVAALTDGTFVTIDGSGGMLAVTTPYDEKIAALNAKMAATALYAGSASARVESDAAAHSLRGASAEAVADRMAFRAKTGALATAAAPPPAVVGAVDLVAQPAALESLSDDKLPERVRRLAPEARKDFVAKEAKERQAIQEELSALSKDRAAWVNTHATKKEDAFDTKVMEDVKKKAADYGVTY